MKREILLRIETPTSCGGIVFDGATYRVKRYAPIWKRLRHLTLAQVLHCCRRWDLHWTIL